MPEHGNGDIAQDIAVYPFVSGLGTCIREFNVILAEAKAFCNIRPPLNRCDCNTVAPGHCKHGQDATKSLRVPALVVEFVWGP